MSSEKNLTEALRWHSTAMDDLQSAQILKQNGQYAHSCFHSQQAGEKALMAVWYFLDADPWGHSIKKLMDDLRLVDKNVFASLRSLERDGMVLDRFYIPARYPNGLPDLTPDAAFAAEDAASGIAHAENILNAVSTILKSDPNQHL